jgi:NAD(P)-dependent dehydrogenase (short-subunit alcohol dehydrogenase family)
MDMELRGKTVVITGGSGGIGRGLVHCFTEEGANVASIDLDEGSFLAERAQAAALPGRVISLRVDITKREEVDKAVVEIQRTLGPIQVLVNNAGGSAGIVPFENVTEPDRRWADALNLDGFVNCVQAIVPGMLAQGSGSIVNIASNAALLGSRNNAYYSGMKGFMTSISKSLAREWGPRGVRVNCIAPGWIVPYEKSEVGPTSFWSRFGFDLMGTPEQMQEKMEQGKLFNMSDLPIPRLGRPEDIAKLAIFFASDVSSYLTGQIVSVSGGAYMH